MRFLIISISTILIAMPVLYGLAMQRGYTHSAFDSVLVPIYLLTVVSALFFPFWKYSRHNLGNIRWLPMVCLPISAAIFLFWLLPNITVAAA